MWSTPRTVPSMGDIARPGARRWTYTTPSLATARQAATAVVRRAFWALALSWPLWWSCSVLIIAACIFAVVTRRPTLDAALIPPTMIAVGLWGYWRIGQP